MSLSKIISGAIWAPVYFLLFGMGVYLTIKTNFFQIRKFGFMLKKTVGMILNHKKSDDKGSFTPWQAVATSLASTIGTGNIVGVSTAIVAGGPGSVFWMWLIAFFGMMIKYAEVVLAIKFRERNSANEWCGGPMYYIKKGLKAPILASAFAVFMILSTFCAGALAQVNSIAMIIEDYISLPKIATGIILTIVVAMVVLGGMQSIGKVTETIVPLMSVLYIVGSLFTLLVNFKAVPSAFADIFVEAFRFKSMGAGVLGYGVAKAMHYGIARGTSSSEAGIGSAPVAQAATNLKEPVEQGLYGILEVFVSSILICTLTALVILTGNVYDKVRYETTILDGGLSGLDNGVVLTAKSFGSAMGMGVANLFITLCIIFFALSTIIGWFYYGSKAFEFAFKDKFLGLYKIIFLGAILFGSWVDVNLVWELSDISNGLMAIPNLIGLIFLGKIVLDETKKYFDK